MIHDRPTFLKVNLDNILYNYNSIKELFSNKDVVAVIKADAYGHGAKVVYKYLYENGVRYFAVTTLEEAMELRTVMKDGFVLVLGAINPYNIQHAMDDNISVCCPSLEWLKDTVEILKESSGKLKIHLKIDSGMSRVGIANKEEMLEAIELLENDKIELEGVFTHYANADDTSSEYDEYQYKQFESLVSLLKEKPKYIHNENSAATLRYADRDNIFTLARVGIALYGAYPSEYIKEVSPVKLKTVSSLISNVIHVKKIAKGTKVGYGCTYTSEDDEYIATIPIGYRDGLLRRAQGWNVLINGEKCEIVGRVCMDQLMVRCSDKIEVGDDVLFYGEYKNDFLDVADFASYQGTIHYEIYCVIGVRVPRRYYIDGKEVEIS